NDRIAGHRGRGVQPYLAGDQIDLLVVAELEIDHAGVTERWHRNAGFGVECDEAIAGRDVRDALFAPVGPIRQSAAGETAGRALSAEALLLAMHPQELACGGIERHHVATGTRDAVDHTARHERSRFQVELRSWPQAGRVEPPGDLELVKVCSVDLVQRRISRISEVTAIRPPFTVLSAGLRAQRRCAKPKGKSGDCRRNNSSEVAHQRLPAGSASGPTSTLACVFASGPSSAATPLAIAAVSLPAWKQVKSGRSRQANGPHRRTLALSAASCTMLMARS